MDDQSMREAFYEDQRLADLELYNRDRADADGNDLDEVPDCRCGWSGTGNGPNGSFIRSDRCPNCGMSLY